MTRSLVRLPAPPVLRASFRILFPLFVAYLGQSSLARRDRRRIPESLARRRAWPAGYRAAKEAPCQNASMPAVGRLVLWDIDRTLLDAGRLGRQVYAEAFHAVTGQQLRHMVDLAGRTDHDIIQDTLALHGLPAADAILESFYHAITHATFARRTVLRERGRALPGARQALDTFAALPNLLQSVVTGNIRSTAEQKLSAFDLARQLDLNIGGYGSDDGQRAVLVRLAIERAERHHGVRYDRDHVAVIGDTPHDIAGARANAVRAVGVATGSSTTDDLHAAGADAVLVDLSDTAAVLRAVLGT